MQLNTTTNMENMKKFAVALVFQKVDNGTTHSSLLVDIISSSSSFEALGFGIDRLAQKKRGYSLSLWQVKEIEDEEPMAIENENEQGSGYE